MFYEILIGLHSQTRLENSGLSKVKDCFPAGFLRTLNMLKCVALQDTDITCSISKKGCRLVY